MLCVTPAVQLIVRCLRHMRLILVALSTFPVSALAEVSDKMATIPQLWVQGAIGSLALLLLVRLSRWFALPGAAVVAFLGIGSYETFADPFVGPAILHEQGTPYLASSYGSVALMAAGLIVGFAPNRRRRTNGT